MKKLHGIFLAFSLSFISSQLKAEESIRDFGITIPVPAKSIGEHRYQSVLTYEDSKKLFNERFRNHPSIRLVGELSLPHVRTISYKNINQESSFSYINISLNILNGLTEIYFVKK
jgi:hypothetical protein